MSPIDRADTTYYSTLVKTVRLSCTVFDIHRKRGNEVHFLHIFAHFWPSLILRDIFWELA